MMIKPDMTHTCFNTPLVRLEKASAESGAILLAKVEFFNPTGSVKDRIGYAMIEDAWEKGLINRQSVIVEPTSGNTGIALAFVAGIKELTLILTMPESMSIERRKLLKHLGARLVLTPGAQGMKGAISEAVRIVENTPDAYMPDQFSNPSNPKIHRETTAVEIWEDTGGQVDIFVAGVGTGGTITGVSEVLKQKKPAIRSVAVEPADSPVLSGGKPGPHSIQGIGAGFVPAVLNRDIIDDIVTITTAQALSGARQLALQAGMLCGISSGANYAAARQVASRPENRGKTIVFVVCDTGERYISTGLFS